MFDNELRTIKVMSSQYAENPIISVNSKKMKKFYDEIHISVCCYISICKTYYEIKLKPLGEHIFLHVAVVDQLLWVSENIHMTRKDNKFLLIY